LIDQILITKTKKAVIFTAFFCFKGIKIIILSE